MSFNFDLGQFQDDTIKSIEFHPDELIKKVQQNIPRTLHYRPQDSDRDEIEEEDISEELQRLNPHSSMVVTSRIKNKQAESIAYYSGRLFELLYLLNEEAELDDSSRINIESSLFELTSYIPTSSVKETDAAWTYPADTLSKILIDNYKALLKFSSNYFNLSLSSHITKYTVEVIYSLQYWEVYHLVHILSDFEYFLKLIGFEVHQTPFGPIVKPPMNYLNDQMLCGLQYPFPYPFYNYSYHSFDEQSTSRKYKKIHITPYVDITLKNTNEPVRKRRRIRNSEARGVKVEPESRKPTRMHSSALNTRESSYYSEGDGEDTGDDYDNRTTDNEQENSFRASENTMDEYPQSRNMRIGAHESEMDNQGNYSMDGMAGTPETGNASSGDDKRNKSKSGVIHQCHLVDPGTFRPCLKIFYGKNELLRHQEFVHATKKKIYKCVYCSRNGSKIQSYPRHDSLARHIRRKHGITGKENKMAVNYAKENVEIVDDPSQKVQATVQQEKPLPHPQYMNPDFTIKPNYAGFLSFSTKDGQQPQSQSQLQEEEEYDNQQHHLHQQSQTQKKPEDQDEAQQQQQGEQQHQLHEHHQQHHQLSQMSPSNIVNKNRVVGVFDFPPIEDPSGRPSQQHQPQPQPQHQVPMNFAEFPFLPPAVHRSHIQLPPPTPMSFSPHANKSVKVDTVNFNKPEASAIKENFQKFRLNSSPPISHTIQFQHQLQPPIHSNFSHPSSPHPGQPSHSPFQPHVPQPQLNQHSQHPQSRHPSQSSHVPPALDRVPQPSGEGHSSMFPSSEIPKGSK